ncbi:D-isomer specific 2-hydroxyacid dehydrogenase family protein [uncultured Peptoniphilus sp.]|uniref:NAD(P)-dependent oxidoreductase n=1 Tax=uncultured Peptoniphilus sp. TaxID=254354 RepID=UPI00260D8574|nr:2-hydroxyacid dehydrogenase [uncultured Peptoniphilus sp.]
MKYKVVLAGKYPQGTFERFKTTLNRDFFDFVKVENEEEYNSMKDADILILRVFKAPRKIIDNNKNLKIIMRWGAGYDSVDVDYASKKGIIVTNTPGANAYSVAELTIMLMLAVGRKLLSHQECLKNGIWSKNTFINESYSLNNKTLGIIGAGNIGRRVAKYAQVFGARTQYYDEYRLSEEKEREYNLEYKDFDEILKTSDILTLHVPLTEYNRHLIGKHEFDMMKKGSIIINTSRGGLIDDNALLEAVNSGKLLGVGLDVVENEPLDKDNELLKNPNIIVTPHIGGGTADISDIIIPMLVDDLNKFVKGENISHVVNRDK